MKLNIDFETRSLRDLKPSGTYVYARDPSTRVLCAAYSIDEGPIQVWFAAAEQPMPDDLRAAFDNPQCEVHAWNAQFERLITRHVVGIDVPLSRWRCTAAHARLRSLPGKLEGALNFLGLKPDLADKRRGTAVMLKWCKLLPDRTWANDPDEYVELFRYCMADVRSEQRLATLLAAAPMTPLEQDEYELNERVNDTGLPIDSELALAAADYGTEEKRELSQQLIAVTRGEITTTSQHTRIKEWLQERIPPAVFEQCFMRTVRVADKKTREVSEVRKASTDRACRQDFLAGDEIGLLDPDVREVLELIDDAGKASVAKFAKMAARAVDNGRAEGSYLLAGAGQTKRYSSQGIQMHNLPRQGLPDVPAAISQVIEHRIPKTEKVMHVLAGLLRPTIEAPAGRELVWGDWSSVEARGMPWLAGNQAKLDLYRAGVDVYKRNACDIFDIAQDDVTDHQRQVGKVAELSLQFGGSVGALKNMARNYGIGFDDDTAEAVVTGWRNANKWASKFSQGLLNAFAGALLFPGELVYHAGVTYEAVRMSAATGLTVCCTLPGGTRLYYQDVLAHIYVRQGNAIRPAGTAARTTRHPCVISADSGPDTWPRGIQG